MLIAHLRFPLSCSALDKQCVSEFRKPFRQELSVLSYKFKMALIYPNNSILALGQWEAGSGRERLNTETQL